MASKKAKARQLREPTIKNKPVLANLSPVEKLFLVDENYDWYDTKILWDYQTEYISTKHSYIKLDGSAKILFNKAHTKIQKYTWRQAVEAYSKRNQSSSYAYHTLPINSSIFKINPLPALLGNHKTSLDEIGIFKYDGKARPIGGLRAKNSSTFIVFWISPNADSFYIHD